MQSIWHNALHKAGASTWSAQTQRRAYVGFIHLDLDAYDNNGALE